MANTKDTSGAKQTDKILFNCTKNFKRQVKALAKIQGLPMNTVVRNAVAAVISERQDEIDKVLALNEEYDQRLEQLALDLPKY